jgi:hypothetical protein
VIGHAGGQSGIAKHDGHNGVFARDNLKTQGGDPLSKKAGIGLQPIAKFSRFAQ